MRSPLRVQARGRQLTHLEQMYNQADDPRTQLRVQMVLLSQAGHSGRPPEITPAIEAFLRECIPQSPRAFKLKRPSWITALLAQLVKRRFKVQVTDECIRRHLERVEVVCRRPTWTVKHLAEPQPGYAQKVGRICMCSMRPS